jgi:hypothetical protein
MEILNSEDPFPPVVMIHLEGLFPLFFVTFLPLD